MKNKQYDIGVGHLGNGLTIWNRAEEVNGDYKTIDHIETNRLADAPAKHHCRTGISLIMKMCQRI